MGVEATITGVVKGGLIVPSAALPEGARVEIRLAGASVTEPEGGPATTLSPDALRKLPRQQRQAVLAEAAALAEEDYRSDKELTGFDAFSEEELDDDDSDAR
jgi:hypothetical protein